jgi:predicted ATPase
VIRKLQIQNYRCPREVEIELEPLTVFVGANASGKSSALASLTETLRETDRWRREGANTIRIVASTDKGTELRAREPSTRKQQEVPATFPRCQLIQLDLVRVRATNLLQKVDVLSRDG